MKRSSFANESSGVASVYIGSAALVLYVMAFRSFLPAFIVSMLPAISLIGLVLGAFGINTRAGAVGTILNFLPLFLLLWLYLALQHLTLSGM